MNIAKIVSNIEHELDVLAREVKSENSAKASTPHASSPSLDKARRETLKAHLALHQLETEYEDILGLEMVDAIERPSLMEVANARQLICVQYARYDDLKNNIKHQIKTMQSKLSDEMLMSLKELETRIKEQGRKLQVLLLNTPELGMTFSEWESMSADDKRASRSPGRPKAPIEASLIQAKRDVQQQLDVVRTVSKGSISTLEEAINIQLSNSGRPVISEIAKMDRNLTNLKKRLEALEAEEEQSSMHDIKVDRLHAQIRDLRSNIIIKESELKGVEIPKRELEKLRSQHRDFVVAEMVSRGKEQIELLMNILRNETAQLDVIEQIMEIDPMSSISVTHKVNPKETRQRFNRLRMNGRLLPAEMEEVEQMESRFKAFSYARRR